jgi:hypothetical protein
MKGKAKLFALDTRRGNADVLITFFALGKFVLFAQNGGVSLRTSSKQLLRMEICHLKTHSIKVKRDHSMK